MNTMHFQCTALRCVGRKWLVLKCFPILDSLFVYPSFTYVFRWLKPVTVLPHTRDVVLLGITGRGHSTKVLYFSYEMLESIHYRVKNHVRISLPA